MLQIEGQVVGDLAAFTITGSEAPVDGLPDGDYKVIDGELYKKVNQAPPICPGVFPFPGRWAPPYQPYDIWMGGDSKDLPDVTWTTVNAPGVSAY